MKSCILITGGAGFIGCEIAARLGSGSLPIIAVDNLLEQVHPSRERPQALPDYVELKVADVRDSDFWREFFSQYAPTVIYHLAAETGTGQSLLEATRHSTVNVVGLTEMLDAMAARSIHPDQIILSSSRAVYGEGAWAGSDGVHFYPGLRPHEMLARSQWNFDGADGKPARAVLHDAAKVHPRPTSVYGATKLAQEHILSAWCAAMGTRLSILRFQNVYGPGQSPFNSYTGIITLFHRQAKAGKTIEVYEDGEIGRDFVFIDDVARACVSALRADSPALETIDIGSGVATTIAMAAQVIADYHGAPRPVVCGKFRDGDVRWAVADVSAMTKAFGPVEPVTFEAGSRAVADWLVARGYV
jgi:dTDP-L-rhamnose 4-epimerase